MAILVSIELMIARKRELVQRRISKATTYLVQGPARVARKRKVHIQRQVHNLLLRVPGRSPWLNLPQAVAHEPDAVHEQPVRRPLDLKVAEEGVRPEQREHLIENVVGLAVRVGRLSGGEVGGGGGQGVGGAPGLGAEGEEGEVAH